MKTHQKKKEVHGCSCWRQTGNQKIWESRVCLFHKALISCFISSSTCGWLPAGLVVWVPSVDTHTYTCPEREREREWITLGQTSHLHWSQISQGSWYLLETKKALFLLSYNMILSACRFYNNSIWKSWEKHKHVQGSGFKPFIEHLHACLCRRCSELN